jgi:drug/metabolite transporter (DMT)-like permease
MHKGVAYALLAALLFGASTPLSKILVGQIAPVALAGLLYMGSGLGLLAWFIMRAVMARHDRSPAARLTAPDLPWLGGAILAGGIAGPVLLMIGLTLTPASSASLLLNMEGVLTALLAWFVFRENFDRRIFIGLGLIVGCAGHCRGLPMLGSRQQSHAQGIGQRCGADRGPQGLDRWFGQFGDCAGAWFADA